MKDDGLPPPTLRRILTFWPLTLYGLGVIVGAGIYVSLGEVIGLAGSAAPTSFVIAGVCAAMTGLAYADLSGRFPEAAGATAYVRHAFGDQTAVVVGGFTTVAAAVSAASIARGAVEYIDDLVPLPATLLLALLIVAFGSIAIWGVRQSVAIAAVIGALEILGLLGAFSMGVSKAGEVWPSMVPGDVAGWRGATAGAFIAFFAFVGFETLANMSEEVRDARRTVPRAILASVTVSVIIYTAVSASAVIGGAGGENSLASLFSGRGITLFTLVASLCVANGALVQITMLSRLFYGMAENGELPTFLARVDKRTGTPIPAIVLATCIVLVASIGLTFKSLIVIANLLTLTIFIVVNLALLRVRKTHDLAAGLFAAPVWAPVIGVLLSLLMMMAHFV